MQSFEPDPTTAFDQVLSTQFFIPILAALLVFAILFQIVRVIFRFGYSGSNESSKTKTESEIKSNMCSNCKYEPIYDKPSGLCRYCVKYI